MVALNKSDLRLLIDLATKEVRSLERKKNWLKMDGRHTEAEEMQNTQNDIYPVYTKLLNNLNEKQCKTETT
jgi:hypothetical protein